MRRSMIWLGRRLMLGAVLVSLSAASNAQVQTYKGRATVVDGDTITVAGQRVRLWGIDAPESQQRCDRASTAYACGAESTRYLAALIGSQDVNCSVKTIDRYQRAVALCTVEGRDIGGEMVSAGWALAFVRYSGDYVRAEADARENRRGLWAGTFTKPWEWRTGQR